MIDDDRIHDMLKARASAAHVPLTGLARAVATSNPRRKARRGLRPALTIAAAAVVLSAVVVSLVVLPGRSPPPDVSDGSQPPNPATASALATATSPPALTTWTALTWYPGDLGRFEQRGRNVFVQAVEYWRGAWIAVGYSVDQSSERVTGLVLHSDDGRTWTRDPEQEDTSFHRLLTTPDEVFLIGFSRRPDVGDQAGPRRAIWGSSDGREWAELPMPSGIDRRWALLDIAIGGRGWLLRPSRIGVDEERWLIGDPSTGWTDGKPAGDVFADAQVNGVVGTDDGWMAYGMTGADLGSDHGLPSGDPANDRGVIWRSTDGSDWSAAQIEDAGTAVGAVHRVSKGWIALGGDHGGCPRCIGQRSLMWGSGDGQAWTPLHLDTSMNRALGWGRFATDGRRGLLFDEDKSGRLRVRETEDGIRWSEIAVFIDASATTLGRTSGGVVGVGATGVVSFAEDPELGSTPQVAVVGDPPASAATQSPAPPPENHDVVCPGGEPCGP